MKASKELMRKWEAEWKGKSKAELQEQISKLWQEQSSGILTVPRANYLTQVIPVLVEAWRRRPLPGINED